jgi:hypothetical protein
MFKKRWVMVAATLSSRGLHAPALAPARQLVNRGPTPQAGWIVLCAILTPISASGTVVDSRLRLREPGP